MVRWYYKLESSQMLKVNLRIFNLGFNEDFLAKMLPDGRIKVPRLVVVELKQALPDLKACFIEVSLEPA